MLLNTADKTKLAKATLAALEGLERAGEAGLSTMQGIALAGTRFPARVHDLREKGWIIKTSRISGDRLEYNYRLIGYNVSNQLTLFKVA